MGANRRLGAPEAYPAAYLSSIRNGSGIMLAEDIPWAPISAAKRFRLCLSLLRARREHPLHAQAARRWSVKVTPFALEVWVADSKTDLPPTVGGALIAKALSGDPL